MNFEANNSNEKVHDDFIKLTKITEVLKEMGLEVIDRFITLEVMTSPTSEAGFPIVRDGVDGIRASYSKMNGLTIWYTNGFEDPNNALRLKIQEKLKEIL